MGRDARAAAVVLAATPTEVKAQALMAAAAALRARSAEILAANAQDMARGEANGLTGALLDRLKIDEKRLEGIAVSLEAVSALPDPVGRSEEHTSELQSLMRISYAGVCLKKKTTGTRMRE